MPRYKLTIEYDGAPFFGWQVQETLPSVQGALETAVKAMCGVDVRVHGAGRTDAGVHALNQVVHFDTDLDRAEHAWVRGINAFLPESIGVRWARYLPKAPTPEQEFHSRFSARSRTYHYLLYNHQVRSPLLAGRAGFTHWKLDVERMREAVKPLIGTHDFTAFRASMCQAKTPVKEMQMIEIERHGDMILFTLRANAFLHHMVRNLVGSLVYVGQGRESTDWMGELLAGKDRTKAAPTFMPDGLYLSRIEYDAKWGLPYEEPSILPAF